MSSTEVAYQADLKGQIVFPPYGTLNEAKAWVLRTKSLLPGHVWAVMP